MNRIRNGSRRRLAAAVSTFALTLGLVSCGSSGQSDGGVTLRVMWWGNAPRHEATNKAIALYEKKHPSVTIEPIYTGWDGYWDKLATQMAGGNAPDVIQMDYAYLNDYAARGTLLDLKDYTGKTLDVSDVQDKLLQSGKLQGGLYAIPWTTNTQTLLVDVKQVKQAGLELPEFGYSWEDLREFGAKLADSTGKGKYAISDMSSIPNVLEVWLGSHGKSLYTEKGKLGFGKEDLRDYWTYWQELSKASIATPASVMTSYGATFDQMSLVRGVAEMDYLWDNQFSGVAEFVQHDMAMVPLPVGQQVGQYLHPSMFLSASAQTEHPKQAAKFIDFMVTNPKAGQILGTNRGIPADQSIRDKLASQANGLDKKVFAYEKKLADQLAPTPPAPPKGNSEVQHLFTRAGEKVAFGRMSIDQAVNHFFSRAEQILAG